MLSLLLGRRRLQLRSRRPLPGVSCCWEELANARRVLTDSFAENVAQVRFYGGLAVYNGCEVPACYDTAWPCHWRGW